MTHKEEICYWAEHPDRTKLWSRSKNGDKWLIVQNPSWRDDYVYIVDDEWAELRKAQADGHELEYRTSRGEWVDDVDLQLLYILDGDNVNNWRIKLEKPVYEYQWITKHADKYRMTEEWHTEKEAYNLFGYAEPYEPSKRERK